MARSKRIKTLDKARGGQLPMHRRGPLQRIMDREALEAEQSALDIITPEQRAKGGYEGDGRRIVNRGGTPVARWIKAGKLSPSQITAIEHCQRLWRITGTDQRVTSLYGEAFGGTGGTESESTIQRYMAAKEDLARVEGYFTGLDNWWNVFVNVCRFDEPAGVAGSRLGVVDKEAIHRALTTVCFIADIIATRERLIAPEGIIRASR